jgi:hypothetical protein
LSVAGHWRDDILESAPTVRKISVEYTGKVQAKYCGHANVAKGERMRAIILAIMVAMTISTAFADEADEAHRLAVSGRNDYWNCLAREFPRDGNRNMSEQDFRGLMASACASERQSFRVALVDFLGLQFPNNEADANITTANNAIALAQKDIVTAFARRKAAAK